MKNEHDFHIDGCADFMRSRRQFLGFAAAGAAWSMLPQTAFASGAGSKDPRFLTIVLRGALDGMAVAAPIGDPYYADLRGDFGLSGKHVMPLDSLFALNANMPNLGQLYQDKDALIVHAAGTSYRKRSHFDGQDVLESGLNRTGGASGWLNRATSHIMSGAKARPNLAVSMGYTAPLIMQGDAPVMSWAPQVLNQPSEDTLNRILGLYEAHEPELATLLRQGAEMDKGMMKSKFSARSNKRFLEELSQTVRFFKDPDGPRVAALSSDGWDTHAAQNPVKGKLANLLKDLDSGIGFLREELSPIWDDMVIAIVTEFGRTVRINGTAGTDHGNGSAAFLIGGAVKGGRVVADWPGLSEKALFQGRDLMPTTHINAIFKGVLHDHLGVDKKALAETVFPDSQNIQPMSGLIA